MATPRQIKANRENAKKSTGPITDEGKQVCRSNALKHGLTAKLLHPPGMEIAAIQERAGMWNSSFRPFEAFDVWLVESVATESIRIDHCRAHEAVIRERTARRAGDDLCWDDDRRMAVDALAVNLGKRPEMIARKLRQTVQGVDWMIERWTGLGLILKSGGQWGEVQRALALDLLGVPLDLRGGRTDIDPPGDIEPSRWHAELVNYEMRRLGDLQQTSLINWDANDREAAIHGVEPTPEPALRLVRRYERACNRRLEWAVDQLRARKREPMNQLSEHHRRPSYQAEATEPERAGREEHDSQRFQAWSAPPNPEVVPDFNHPDERADALRTDPSPAHEPARVVYEAPRLADALRSPMPPPGNRRARRAAAARARKAR